MIDFTREMVSVDIPYAREVGSLKLRSDWLGAIVQTEVVLANPNPQTTIARALEQPIGATQLEELAQPGQQVVIIVDDFTRHTPVAQALPLVLERLTRSRIPPQNICIVIAAGSHRTMAEAEIQHKLGDQIVKQYPIIHSTDSRVSSRMTLAGEMDSGIAVQMVHAVKQADLRIGLGMITPHMDTGFSGGVKIILPGVCSQETVDAFHSRSASQLENPLGNPAAPLRLELERFVQKHTPLHFLLNLILTPEGEIYQCVAGDPIAAHRAGVEYSRKVYGAPARQRYPVVVADCEPYAFDLWQSCKGLWCGDLLTADQGTLIWYTAAPEGKSNYSTLAACIGMSSENLEAELRLDESLDLKIASTALMITRMKARLRIVLVSTGLNAFDAALMGLAYYPTIESALYDAVMALPSDQRNGSVAIIPKAGIMLPVLP